MARTDVQNCVTNLTVEILNQARPLTLPSPTITAATCDRLGTCSFNLGDSIRFAWSDGGTGRTRDLAAGTYTVTATHIITNCSATTQLVIERNCGCTPPVVDISKTDVTCGNTNDGSIALTVSGVSANNLTYTWSPTVSTSASANHLRAGTYFIQVRKTNDTCSALVSVVVSPPRLIQVADALVTPASCESRTGRATFQNANDSLVFRWSDGGSGRARDSLRTGTYTVTITKPSSNECSIIKTIQVGTINPLNTTFTLLNQPSCGRLNGGVLLTTTGGSGRYVYSWGEGNMRFVLSSGNHSVTATDLATGCTSVVTFTLVNQIVTATLLMDTVISTSCNAVADARLTYTMTTSSNFINPARVEIRDLSGRLFTNGLLGIGNYIVTVKDSSGCMTAERRFRVIEPTPIVENMRKRNHNCDSLGYIYLNPSGGGGRYHYDWADLAGTNDPRDRDNLRAGLYTVTISDAYGCSKIIRNIQVKDSCACRSPPFYNVMVTNATFYIT